MGTSAAAPATANLSSLFWKTAIYKFENGEWDYTTGAGKAVKQDAAVTLDANLFAGAAQAFGPAGNQYTTNSVEILSLNTPVALFKTKQSLFLIPPTNTGIATTGDANAMRVLITYDVVTLDDKLDAKKSVIETKAVASLPAGTMKPGVAYKYTFTIGIESVKVSATVDDWGIETDVAVPSADAANATATTINAAITSLNTTKGSNPNCNYFVVNVNGVPSGTVSLAGTTTNFVTADRIEMKCTSVPSGTFTLSGWTATKSGNSVILTKN